MTITFNTQEDFDKAVMAAVEKFLSVKVTVEKEWYSDDQSIEVSLRKYNEEDCSFVEFDSNSSTMYLDK